MTVRSIEPATAPAPSTATTRVRVEIQALRAVAVLGVLLFHLWPQHLPGGYVGVDVFFVVSGYLITDHLLREVDRSGTVRLASFWARRIRRLLPASLLVLLATAVATQILVPDSRWNQIGNDIIASALYVVNWTLAAQSIDYMALSNVKSPVQHFWSLSVEEQFYIVWPVLIVLAVLAAVRWRRAPARAIVAVLLAVTGASFVFSIVSTALQPSIAYFSTATRAWEFGAGALLAVAMRRGRVQLSRRIAVLASWSGFALIAATMIVYTEATPFPSATAALPVLGAVFVMLAGAPGGPFAPIPLLSVKPVQAIGDVSYGAYLWHWPIIVLLPYAIGVEPGTAWKIGILGIAIAAGWLSKILIEDPIRTSGRLSRSHLAWTFAGAVIASATVVAVAWPLATFTVAPPTRVSLDAQPPCYGAKAAVDASCADPQDIPLVARLSSFGVDIPPPDILGCETSTNSGEYRRCDFGSASAPGPHVALIGDSHGTRLLEPLRDIVAAEDGRLSTFLVSGCPMMSSEPTGSAWGYEEGYAQQCRELTQRVHAEVAADPDIDTVVLTDRTRLYVSPDPAFRPLTASAVADSIRALQEAGKTVVVTKDPPEMHAVPPQAAESASDCIARTKNARACATPRSAAIFDDPLAAGAADAQAPVVVLDDLFCDESSCRVQSGGLVVYSDDNHMTRSFASSLTAILGDRLRPLLQ